VTFTTAPATGDTITILRVMPLKQETDYQPNDPFPAETHEKALDIGTMGTQQLDEEMGRTLKFPKSSTEVDVEFPAIKANEAVFGDPAGTKLETRKATDLGVLGLPVALTAGGTGATTVEAARTNLGLGTAAVKNTGVASGDIPVFDNVGYPTADGQRITRTRHSRMPTQIFTATSNAAIEFVGAINLGNSASAITVTLPLTSAVGNSAVGYWKNVGAGVLTIAGSGAETIDGATNIVLKQNEWMAIWRDSPGAWRSFGVISGAAQPAFSVHKNNTNQTGIAPDTSTLITFSTELFDTNNNFASNVFTPTIAGKYSIMAAYQYLTADDQDALTIRIFKNNVVFKDALNRASGTASQGIMIGIVDDANGTTDNYRVMAFHSATANKTIDGTTLRTWFMGMRIGP